VCFSATANFAGSAVLGTAGVVTLTKVKHRRELLFAALPLLFAIHQFIEGFVWLGLDGILSPAVAHDMGAAFMLLCAVTAAVLGAAQHLPVRAEQEEPAPDASLCGTWRRGNPLHPVGAYCVSCAALY
jgi:hypothetical protein